MHLTEVACGAVPSTSPCPASRVATSRGPIQQPMNTCSMQETIVDCGVYAPTSLCPPGTELQQTVDNGPTVPSSNPPIATPQSPHGSGNPGGLSGTALAGVIFVAITVGILVVACLWACMREKSPPRVRRPAVGGPPGPGTRPPTYIWPSASAHSGSTLSLMEISETGIDPIQNDNPPPPAPPEPVYIPEGSEQGSDFQRGIEGDLRENPRVRSRR